MMRKFLFTSFITVQLLSFLNAQDTFWETDYTQVLEKSKNEKKPLLLFFTGCDWSGLSMKMKNEILATKEFQEKIKDVLYGVEIDFPMHAAVSQDKKEANETLKKKFNIEEFPSLVLIDGEEKEIVRLCYIPESGQQFAEDLLRTIKQDSELKEGLKTLSNDPGVLKKLYQIAEELQRKEAKDQILTKGIETGDSFFLMEKYCLIYETNSGEAKALKEKLQAFKSCQIDFTLAMLDFQLLAKNNHLNQPEKIVTPLEAYLEKNRQKDQENIWRIEMMIAQTFLEADDWREALKHANIAIQSSPQEMREEIKHLIDYICDQQIANAD